MSEIAPRTLVDAIDVSLGKPCARPTASRRRRRALDRCGRAMDAVDPDAAGAAAALRARHLRAEASRAGDLAPMHRRAELARGLPPHDVANPLDLPKVKPAGPPGRRRLLWPNFSPIELRYRGAVWHQRNGRDWTVEAFLTSGDGVGLDVAGDNRTRDAMLQPWCCWRPSPLLGCAAVAWKLTISTA